MTTETDETVVRLSPEALRRMAELLEAPPEPSPWLLEAAEEHMRRVRAVTDVDLHQASERVDRRRHRRDAARARRAR